MSLALIGVIFFFAPLVMGAVLAILRVRAQTVRPRLAPAAAPGLLGPDAAVAADHPVRATA